MKGHVLFLEWPPVSDRLKRPLASTQTTLKGHPSFREAIDNWGVKFSEAGVDTFVEPGVLP